MKTFSRLRWRGLGVVLALLLVGCTTTRNKIWTSRVGNYTFDQAVVELGPPDKQAKLENGGVVADWLTHRGYTRAYVSPDYGWYPHHYYSAFPTVTETYSPDYFLRLVFGADGKLQSWKDYAR